MSIFYLAYKMNEKDKLDFEYARELLLNYIHSFPRAKNGKPYLRLRNWKRVFFGLFIRKYGLDWSRSYYSQKDIIRRSKSFIVNIRGLLLQHQMIKKPKKKDRRTVEGERMIAVVVKTKRKWKLELLSFYLKKNNTPV